MIDIKQTWRSVVTFIDHNLPTILTGASVVGLLTSVGSAIKEAPKAETAILDAKVKKYESMTLENDRVFVPSHGDPYRLTGYHDELEEIRLTPMEAIKVLAPIYWPCALSTAATATCIIMSNRVSAKRYAAVLTALGLSERHSREYAEKVKELFGEKKEKLVNQEIAKDHALACPEDLENGYIVGQMYPCCLEIAGLYWISTRQAIENAFNRWNQKGLKEGGDLYLDDLIFELGIDVKDSWLYSHTKWDIMGGKLVEPVIEGGETFNGVPCLSVRLSRHPDN